MNATPNTNYSVSPEGAGDFSDTLLAMFNGTASLDIEGSAASRDAVDTVWKASADLEPWINQLALSMTNALRNSSNSSDDALYNGEAYQFGVVIRWPWIALPAAMVLSSLIFLASVMIRTARSPVEAWKGSRLAFLFFDVEQEMRQHVVGHTDELRGIQDSVSDARVVLKGKPGGILDLWARWIR